VTLLKVVRTGSSPNLLSSGTKRRKLTSKGVSRSTSRDDLVFFSLRNLNARESSSTLHNLNYTGNFVGEKDRSVFTDPGVNSNIPTPKTPKHSNSVISSNQSLESSDYTFRTHTTQYANVMQDIRKNFSEFRTLDDSELELVLKLYDNHFSTPHQISNSAYYVSGALIVLVSIQFINAQNFSGYDTSHFGLTQE
jgi:hypothetical protein